MLFLGGQSQFALEYISKKIGKQTIDNTNRSRSYGKQRSSSSNDSIIGRELMTPDEVALLPESEALLFIKGFRGFRGFKGRKYKLTSHPNYKKLSEDSNFYTHNVKHTAKAVHYVVRIELPNFSDEMKSVEAMIFPGDEFEDPYENESDLYSESNNI